MLVYGWNTDEHKRYHKKCHYNKNANLITSHENRIIYVGFLIYHILSLLVRQFVSEHESLRTVVNCMTVSQYFESSGRWQLLLVMIVGEKVILSYAVL